MKTIPSMNPSMSEGLKCTTRMRYGDDWNILDKYGLQTKIAEAKDNNQFVSQFQIANRLISYRPSIGACTETFLVI